MNAKARRQIATIAGIAGASACAISLVVFGGIHNPLGLVCLASIAGTVGNIVFTGLATLLLRIEKQVSIGRPGQMVYSFGKLPAEEMTSAGGKGSALARMVQAGHRVPDGLIILPNAFSGDDLVAEAWELVQAQLVRLRKADPNGAFAVRSSALGEDSAQASFAGEFETVLDVHTNDAVRAAILTVRRSRHTARVQAYSQAQGLAAEHDIAVVVQRLIRPDYSGVLFTVEPVTGNLAKMAGNFVEGIGEKLVSGQTNAQTFSFDRPKGAYQGPSELGRVAREMYRSACELEDEMGSPQDIEWAMVDGRLYLLQSRPITTLCGDDPVTGMRNDTFQGCFLWSATNLMEAHPDVLTPFTASLHLYFERGGGPSLAVKNHLMTGVIGGRFYANVSVQVSAFNQLFGGDSRRTYREMAGWWGDIPEGMEIPLIPLAPDEWFKKVMPVLMRTNGQLGGYRKRALAFVANNRQVCAEMRHRIEQTDTKERLADLWREEIGPLGRDALYYVLAASSDAQIRLERDLRVLVGPEDATALLSNLSGSSSTLESLGPVLGLGKVARGEMSREAYLDAYGHRGVKEGECAWPRPAEDPAWLDRQLAEFSRTPVEVETLLARQRAAYEAAWKRFCEKHPQKVRAIGKRLEQVAQAAQRREAVRSEAMRATAVERAFALRAGEMIGIGENVFFLTLDETLAALTGDASACQLIPARKETYERLRALPPYPALIKGRFDPFVWATDPNRRSDVFDADASTMPCPDASNTVKGFAGALGVVEGTVRRLERLEDSDQLLPGEILVAPMTNIGWTPVFPRLAAIVTDLGAPLSHAAIVARELGIPAVVGCGDATMHLATGDRVRVDGGKGLVEILESKM
jgi:phosphohistidine swiveling domain-containing protein